MVSRGAETVREPSSGRILGGATKKYPVAEGPAFDVEQQLLKPPVVTSLYRYGLPAVRVPFGGSVVYRPDASWSDGGSWVRSVSIWICIGRCRSSCQPALSAMAGILTGRFLCRAADGNHLLGRPLSDPAWRAAAVRPGSIRFAVSDNSVVKPRLFSGPLQNSGTQASPRGR